MSAINACAIVSIVIVAALVGLGWFLRRPRRLYLCGNHLCGRTFKRLGPHGTCPHCESQDLGYAQEDV
jgi:hypothetical protein